MLATALDSTLSAADELYDRLVHRNGCFIAMNTGGIRCKVIMPAALVKNQPTGFLAEIDRLRAELLHLAKVNGHQPPVWMTNFAFGPVGEIISDMRAEEALRAAATNLGVQPEDIEHTLGENAFSALMVI